MTQVFDEAGHLVPVTLVELGPNVVIQKKTVETDGYEALRVGFEDVKEKHLVKPLADDMKKRNVALKRVQREVESFDPALEVGSVITCDIFNENDVVTVIGTSKG
jgi:large subunit ribosomal protein L3